MLHVWLRAQHSPLAVWQADTQQWQMIDSWQQLYDTYGAHNSAHNNAHKNNSDKTLCLYFPSSYVLQVDTALNAAQLKQLGNVGKQYLFEETSLTSVEQLVIRQISQVANSQHLYALAQSDIESWQQSATLVGLTISALLPDFLLLPIPEEGAGQQVVLYQDEYTTLLRQSEYQGLAVSYLPLVFERLPQLSEVFVLPALHLSSTQALSAPVSALVDELNYKEKTSKIALEKVEHANNLVAAIDDGNFNNSNLNNNITAETVDLITEQQLLLTILSTVPTPVEIPERHALNFFTKSSNSQLSPYLRIALMVALSALVLQIGTDGVQSYRYKAAAAATQTGISAQYQSWFANEKLNPRLKLETQMRGKLRNDSQASTSHMAVLARISPLIKQSSMHAQALVMQPTALSFTLVAPDRNSLDEFAATLNAQGLVANLQQVNSNDQGQFSGQFTVNIAADNANKDTPAAS